MHPLLYCTRRDFVTNSLKLLSAAATLPVFLGRTCAVLADAPRKRRGRNDDQRILVVLQLAGGNDGLNTVIPFEQDLYYRFRQQIAIPRQEVIALGQGVGLHPAASGLKALLDAGHLAIVQGVGYPNPNRSHFVSTDIWESADPQLRRHDGWLGRYFDACCTGADPDPRPLDGIALVQEAPLMLRGEKFMPLAFSNASDLSWRGGVRDPQAAAAFEKLNAAGAPHDADAPGAGAAPASGGSSPAATSPPAGRAASSATSRPGASATARPEATAAARTPPRTRRPPSPAAETGEFLQRAALEALASAAEIRAAADGRLGGARRGGRQRGGGQLGQQLQMVGRMIRAGLSTRVYYVSLGGFDTHTGQLARHAALLRQFGDGLEDFITGLAEDKLLDRVLVMCFTEFGRRVQENSSGGTDHGEAGPMFLFGGGVRPGLHERHPDLARLHRGDLAFGCDFRRVYAAVLRDWLDTPPAKVLGPGFTPLEILGSARR